MSRYRDYDQHEYLIRWQTDFSLAGKRLGQTGTARAQRWVSQWRIMRRRLLRGGKPSLLDFRRQGEIQPENYLLKRGKEKLDRAIDRGEAMKSMQRRGLFDALRDHQRYRQFRKQLAVSRSKIPR